MPHLKYNSPRPPAFTVIRKRPDGVETRYCADHIHGVVGNGEDSWVPQIGFLCSGQHTQFPAAELVSIEIYREGAGHCNACDRQYPATVVED